MRVSLLLVLLLAHQSCTILAVDRECYASDALGILAETHLGVSLKQ